MGINMARKGLCAATVFAASMLTGFAASANPIYIGYSFNGGATITQVGNSGADGSASSNGIISVGNGFSIQVSGTGAPVFSQGTLLSNTTSVSSTQAGTITIYVSETTNTGNMSTFTTGFSNDSGSTTSVTEATYATSGNTAFAMGNLLAQSTVAPGAAVPSSTVSAPAGLTSPFTVSDVYTITYGAGGGSTVSTLTLRATTASVPEPVSIALLGTGLVGLGLIRSKRRKA